MFHCDSLKRVEAAVICDLVDRPMVVAEVLPLTRSQEEPWTTLQFKVVLPAASAGTTVHTAFTGARSLAQVDRGRLQTGYPVDIPLLDQIHGLGQSIQGGNGNGSTAITSSGIVTRINNRCIARRSHPRTGRLWSS